MKVIGQYLLIFWLCAQRILTQSYDDPTLSICPLECRCSFESHIDCSGANISTLPALITERVQFLNLSHNAFERIPTDLSELSNLEILNLDFNNIGYLDARSLDIKTLTELDVSHNKFNTWQDINPSTIIERTTSLKKLTMDHNNFRHIDIGLKSNSLQHLSLQNCGLTNVSVTMLNDLYNIRTVSLNHNKLSYISLQSTTLQYLSLRANGIRKLSDKFLNELPNLKELILIQNRIYYFNPDLSTSLEKLHLAFCNLQYASFSGIPSLTWVNLKGNHFRKIGSNFFNNQKLVYINLEENAIEAVNEYAFQSLKSLVELRMSKNRIFRLSSDIFAYNNQLKYLDLSHNFLKNINFQSISLEVLDMSFCEIQTIQEGDLYDMIALKVLNLSRNIISSISLMDSLSLEHLDLSMNKLSSINKQTFSNLINLKILNLSGNRLMSGMKENFFPDTLYYIILNDNLWICDCKSKDFRDFYDYLLRLSYKGKNKIFCNSPENVVGHTWESACANAWSNKSEKKMKHTWIFVVVVLVVSLLFILSIFTRRRSIDRRQQRVIEQRNQIVGRSVDRVRNAGAQRAPQLPRTPAIPADVLEQRPPSYAEAILMARVDGSMNSIAGSRGNISSSNTDVSRRRTARPTQNGANERVLLPIAASSSNNTTEAPKLEQSVLETEPLTERHVNTAETEQETIVLELSSSSTNTRTNEVAA